MKSPCVCLFIFSTLTAHSFILHHTGTQLRTIRGLSSSNTTSDQAELFQQLDATFDYKGRIQSPTNQDHRCGFVSVVGAPNMGKSTLVNALLEADLCITTAKPQTTRHAILGILSTDAAQVCLVDTPGVIQTPAYKLQEGMMEAVVGAFHDADVLLVVTDVFSTPIPSDKLFQRVQASPKPIIVAVNKIDLSQSINPYDASDHLTIAPEQAIHLWRQLLPNALAILPVTASAGPIDPGIAAIRALLTNDPDVPAALRGLGRPIPGMVLEGATLTGLLPLSPPLYDAEHLTDKTERFVASEIVRAALLESLHSELPYCCQVEITAFREAQDSIEIESEIVVERESQKGIVVGKGGKQIGTIRAAATQQLEAFFETKVLLKLFVKVEKDWRKNPKKLIQYGYLKK